MGLDASQQASEGPKATADFRQNALTARIPMK